MTSTILQTKLHVPLLRSSLVPRPRLIDRLNKGMNGGLTLISASAGYGKTTLVAEWLPDLRFTNDDFGVKINRKTEIGNQVAWLSLDESDNDPRRFLVYLLAALRQIQPDIGQSIEAMLQSLESPPSEVILTALVNEISALPQPFILVLDDYHAIHTPSIHQQLDFLLEHRPQQMNLIVVTRQDPPLSLSRLRARGQLTEIRQDDLRFSSDECADFLRLISELNRAMVELNNQGVINNIAQQYLGLSPDESLPTPAPTATTPPNQPTATAAPVPACSDGVTVVTDLTYPDYEMQKPPLLNPGRSFIKGWRLKNTGTCTWTSSYFASYVKGNVSAARLSGQPTAIVGSVPPGGTYDLYVNLVAPIQPGIYQGYWTMNNAKSTPFGKLFWVGIQVVSGPTVPPPVITVTPSPYMDFDSDQTVINAGDAVTFSWVVQGAEDVYFYAQGERWQDNKVKAEDSRTVHPPQTTIYELKAIYLDGTTEKQQIRIDVVQPAPEAPDIKVFKAYPKQVESGGTVTIEWKVEVGELLRTPATEGQVRVAVHQSRHHELPCGALSVPGMVLRRQVFQGSDPADPAPLPRQGGVADRVDVPLTAAGGAGDERPDVSERAAWRGPWGGLGRAEHGKIDASFARRLGWLCRSRRRRAA